MALQLKVLMSTGAGVSTGDQQGQTKMMRFNQNMSVSQLLAEIKDKTGEGGRDHGIFQPADEATQRPARWLRPEKTLQFYDLQSGDLVEYKKKHKPIKVKLIDGTVKMFLIDDSLPTNAIVQVIGAKMDLKNPDEFSLCVDKKLLPGKKTKKKEGDIVEKKYKWLTPTQSLNEQGIPEDALLVLKKKLFVDDGNLDRNDQVQLHLLYAQCLDAVLEGDYPVTKDEAAQFSALQCQILFGNFDQSKHTKKALEARCKEIAPKAYRGGNSIKIYNEIVKEWRTIVNMTDINAKYRYIQLCRSLKSYGITYFNSKFKPKGAQRLKGLLVGISKDSILFSDAETKAVLKEHPITHLKRWAGGPNTFTFDFGDYADTYFSIQTNEGDAIAQLLAGYIDIIMKRRKDGGVIVDDNDGEMPVEEYIAGEHGTLVEGITTSEYYPSDQDYTGTSLLSAGGKIPGISPPIAGQVGKASTLGEADEAILSLMGDLMNPIPIGQHGSLTPEQLRQDVVAKNQKLASAAGALIDATSEGPDREKLNNMAPDLARNLANLIGAAKLAAAAAKGDVSLLDGAKSVADALRQVMQAAGEVAENPNSAEARLKLAQAAALLQATTGALNAQCIGNKADQPTRDLMLESAKAVAAATRDFLQSSQHAVAMADPETKKKELIGKTKVQMKADSVSDIVNASAPVIVDPKCKAYVGGSAKALTQACNALLSGIQGGINDPEARNDLAKTAKAVNEALSQLVNSTACAASQADADKEKMAAAAFEIQDGLAKLMSADKDSKQIVAAARAVQVATGTLVESAKGVARVADPNEKNRLLGAMKDLTQAVGNMLQTAQQAASDPDDETAQRRLHDQAQAVSEATRKILGDVTTKQAAMAALRTASKAVAAATSGLVAECKDISHRTQDPQTAQSLQNAAADAASAIAELVKGVKDSWLAPDDIHSEDMLKNAAKNVGKPSTGLVSVARAAVPKVGDMKDKTTLNAAATEVTNALRKLNDALKAAKEADGHMEVDEALQAFAAAVADLDYAIASAEQGQFEPIPGQTRDGALGLLNASANSLKNAANDLQTASKVSPKAMGPPAKATTTELANLMSATKAMVSTMDSAPGQAKLLTASKGVADETERLINAGRALSVAPEDKQLFNNVAKARDGLDSAIDYLVASANNTGAGAEECEAALASIAKASEALSGIPTTSRGDLQDFAEELQQALKALDAAVGQVSYAARNNPQQLGPAANLTASTLPPILDSANNASAKTPDKVAGTKILAKAKQLADDTGYFLTASKVLASKPNDYESDQAVSQTAKDVRADMAELLKAVDAAVPGKREIMQARDIIDDANSRLTKPSVPRENPQVHLREISDAARRLADSVGRIVASSRHFPEKLGGFSKDAANAVSDIIDAAKDASSNDPASGVYLSSTRVKTDAEKALEDPADLSNVLDAAKNVARDSGDLLANIKRAAGNENDPNKRKALIGAADNAVRETADMAAAAKALAQHKDGAADQLNTAVQKLNRSIQAILASNPRGRQGQDFVPLLDAARMLADETSRMIDLLKVVSGRPKDATAQTQLTVSAQKTGQAIRAIVEAADSLTYGHAETKRAIEVMQKALGDLDATAISATVPDLLKPPPSKVGVSNQQLKEDLIAQSRELAGITGKLVNAAKSEPKELGKAIDQAANAIPGMVENAIALVATTTDPDEQQKYLKLAKDSVDSVLILVQAAKLTSGKPYDKDVLLSLADSAKMVSNSITELVTQLRGGVLGLRACDEAIKQIEALVALLDDAGHPSGKSYAECTDILQGQAKVLVSQMAQTVTAAKNSSQSPEKVGEACLAMAKVLPQLLDATRHTAAASADKEIKDKLLKSGKEVVTSFRDCAAAAKTVAADPKNPSVITIMSDAQRGVTESLGALLNSARQGAVLERDVAIAVAKIQATTADLDSAALFAAATAGQMETKKGHGTLDSVKAQLTANMKKLATITSGINTNTTGSHDALGKQFKDLAQEVNTAAETSKEMATLLGDLSSQQSVLGSAKAMSLATQSLVLAAKDVATRPDDRASKAQLDKSLQMTSNSIRELVSVAEQAAADAVKGQRELEKAQEEIKQLMGTLNTPGGAVAVKNPRELLPALRNLGTATGQLVVNATSNKDALIKSTQDTTRYIEEMIQNVKGLDEVTKTVPQVRTDLIKASKATCETTIALLDKAKLADESPESQKELSLLSESVADKIMDVVKVLREVPGGENIKGLHDSGPDFDSIAEVELRKAAKMIEDAANRLLSSRPRQVETEFLTEEDINAAILEAARAITVATGGLVKAAVFAQRERIAKQKDPKTKHFYRADPAWANGLISAAQAVGSTTSDLVSSANGFVQREEGMDDAMLISSAKQVAAATARLMAASRAKSDPFSETHQNLGNASKEVANATQLLVDAARKAAEWVSNAAEAVEITADNLTDVAQRKAQLELQAKMIRLQSELDRTRNDYAAANKDAYKDVGGAPTKAPAAGRGAAPAPAGGAPRGGGAAGGAPRGGAAPRGGTPRARGS